MNKKIMLLISLVVLISAMFAINAIAKKEDKITICHVPADDPTKEVTLTLPESALSGHMDNNGRLHELDYFGECIGKWITQCSDDLDND